MNIKSLIEKHLLVEGYVKDTETSYYTKKYSSTNSERYVAGYHRAIQDIKANIPEFVEKIIEAIKNQPEVQLPDLYSMPEDGDEYISKRELINLLTQ